MSKPQWVDKEIQSFSSQLVCICYYIFEKQTQPRGVCFYDTMQPLGEKKPKTMALSKRANKKEQRESWGGWYEVRRSM